ncbi:MAG: cardiolipin synthase [Anaerovoracaceae bacterium]
MYTFQSLENFIEGLPGILTFIYIINFFIALGIIFLERKNSSATLAWIMILYLIPGFGILLYLLFSQNLSKKKMFKLSVDEERVFTNSLKKQLHAISNGSYDFTNKTAHKWQELIRLNQVYGKAYFTQDNKMEIIADGNDKMDRLIEDILNAKKIINIEYFIIKRDQVGKRLVDALAIKAREGLTVRLLVDAMGSRRIDEDWLFEFIAAGGKFATFFPPKFRILNIKFNYRNHRKLAIIDGKISYIGGFNIAKEYIGLKKKFGFWRDTHIRIEGGASQDINGRFLLDWRFAAKDNDIDYTQVFYPPKQQQGDVGIQIVSSGPDAPHEEIKRGFLRMITSAEERIYIQTPYFVPDETILESLKMAAQSGVDVRIMIPCKPDHIFVYWATLSYVSEIIRAGGRVYIYEGGFLHAKTMTVDSSVATVGSANFDRRSFKLNFEANAFIYDKNETRKLEHLFEEDMKKCNELTWDIYQKRGTMIKIKEPIARLLSDIL